MLKIAHRGNLRGPSIDENKPHYIMKAIYEGFDAECDLWYTDNGYYLGHDKPIYKVEHYFLLNKHLWIHCKNIEAFVILSNDKDLHLVFHEEKIALTSKGYLWTAPGLFIGYNSIAVMPELAPGWDISNAKGICTDFIFG